MRSRAIMLAMMFGAALPSGSKGACYDPGGYCGPCPCEDACYLNIDCPAGSLCRSYRTGPSACGCAYSFGEYVWFVTTDVARRCEKSDVYPGPLWFDVRVIDAFPGKQFSKAWAINVHGQVLANSDDVVFIWDEGVLSDVASNTVSTRADMNDTGRIVYTTYGEGDARGTFLVDHPGEEAVRIHDNYARTVTINNVGQVLIGADQNGQGEAALWESGVTTPIHALSDPPLQAPVLNNMGHLAGRIGRSGAWQPALLVDDTLIELEEPTEQFVYLAGINDLDQIAYVHNDPLYDPKSGVFLWDDGVTRNLEDLIRCYQVGWIIAINNCGEMLLEFGPALHVRECAGVFPLDGDVYYSPETGYRHIATLLEEAYRWDHVYLVDINDRGQIIGNANIWEFDGSEWWYAERGIVISPIPGDLTRDGRIDLNDYARFFERFGKATTDYSIYCNRADFDEDADTDLHDFAVFQNLFTGAP